MDRTDEFSASAPKSEVTPVARAHATWTVLLAGMLALALGPAAISLVREQLHIQCSLGQPGSEGADTWMCSDGIGYVGVAVTFGAMWFFTTLAGSLIAGILRHERTARLLLLLLAALSAGWTLWWTWYGSTHLVGDEFAPMPGVGYWSDAVGPSAIACGTAFAFALGGLVSTGRAARVACGLAVLGFLVAVIVQPGVIINVLPAAGVAAAAAIRTTVTRPHPPARTSI
jgi:hypothetical protein